MFADPQTVTVNAVAKVMARYLVDGTKANYQTADGLFTLTISHQSSKGRTRSMVRIDQKAIVTNPLDSTNDYDTLSFYTVIDRPAFGFTTAQVEQLIAGLKTWLDNTAIDKLLGSES
jgi:hypothetical protein